MHELPETIPTGLDGVVEVELLHGALAREDAAPDLLIEVPHGADQRAHFDALQARLSGPFPADLHEFFHVNTDTGAWQLGRRAAELLIAREPHRSALVVRCLVPRTFIDCNRLADAAAQGDLAAQGITGAVQPYVRDRGDLRLLHDLHAAYTEVAEHAYAWVCGAGGVAVEPHTYGPRTLEVSAVDDDIIPNLRRAHSPQVWERSPLRAEVDLITGDADGVRQADDAVVEDFVRRLTAAGRQVVEGGTYYLHPATMGAVHHARWPGQVLCFEVRRDLLVEGYHPFVQQVVLPERVEPLADALAETIAGWLAREVEMKPILESLDLEAFALGFLEHYVQGGFGRMPKRDIDLLVVHLLMRHGRLDEHSDWELAQLLHTTPTRIRNLRTDARFLYWDDAQRQDHIRRRFFGALAGEAFSVRGTTITVQLPDPFVRQALKAALMDQHKLMDTSFNGALLKMGPDGFAVLFQRFLDAEQREVLAQDPKTREAMPQLSDRVRAALVQVGADGAKTLNRGALIALSEAALAQGTALVGWMAAAL